MSVLAGLSLGFASGFLLALWFTRGIWQENDRLRLDLWHELHQRERQRRHWRRTKRRLAGVWRRYQ